MIKVSTESVSNNLFSPAKKYFSNLNTMLVVSGALLGLTFSAARGQAAAGEALFKTKCTMCHGQQGEGIAIFPPLAGSEWVNGPEENLVRIQLRGLMGPIKVKGKTYSGVMPNNAAMTDQEIADVLTYVRSSMGNKAPAVAVDTVKKIRAKEKGNSDMLKVEDLIDPLKVITNKNVSPKSTFINKDTEMKGFKPAQTNGSSSVVLLTLGIIGLCSLPALIGLKRN